MTKQNDVCEEALNIMLEGFNVLFNQVKKPTLIQYPKFFFYRYQEKTIQQAIIQKLARVITGLQSVTLLNNAGFIQEQASIQRMLDEFVEDIEFLSIGIIFNDITALHSKYLDAFYEEELDVLEDALASTQKRPMISRQKIRAYITKDRGQGNDPSTTNELHRTIHKAYSGYVHGASSQIMELYYGYHPTFHLNGNIDSPLFELHKDDIFNYYYRALLAFGFAASAFRNEYLSSHFSAYCEEFLKQKSTLVEKI
jgi:hypothetical protein